VKSQKQLSAKAKQVKVASQKGQGPTLQRTDIAEAWVPLHGSGSDARLLVRLQGVFASPEFTSQLPFHVPCAVTKQ
jgi:hypothetical protein